MPARCVDMTVAQRRSWVEAYWEISDPAFSDGEGAETLLGFVARAQAFLDRLAEHPASPDAVFSHGQILNAVAMLQEGRPEVFGWPD